MKNMKNLLIILCAMLIACAPDQFYLNSRSVDSEEISGLIIGNLDNVDVYAKNALKIHESGMVDLICRSGGITQMKADITTNITSGDGVRFAFRTIMDSYDTHPSITFDFTKDGCFVNENNRSLTKVDTIKAKIGESSRILIENYGKLVNIVVGCDTVYFGPTGLSATEHIIISPLNSSDVDLSGIIFSNMNADKINYLIK